MKKLILASLLALAACSPMFAFGFISLLQDEGDMVVSGDAYYGNFIFAPVSVFGAGATAEFGIGVPKLFVGGSVYYDNLTISGYNFSSVDVSAYAKYFFLSAAEGKKLLGAPVGIGAAAGAGYSIFLSDVSLVPFGYGNYVTPLSVLAVGIASYDFPLFGTTCTASVAVGYVDRDFGYYVDLWFPVDKKFFFHVYWVPIVGLGASATLIL